MEKESVDYVCPTCKGEKPQSVTVALTVAMETELGLSSNDV